MSQNLNYCQHCGSRNKQNPLIVSNSSTNLLICAGGAIGVIGLIVFFTILRELLRSQITPSAMIVILIAYLATVFLMFGVLIGHGWKRSGDIRIAGSQHADDDDYRSPRSFRGVNTAQLEPMGAPPASVTDHTTRTLEDTAAFRK